MTKEDEINDSLEFCRDIYLYYEQYDTVDSSGTTSGRAPYTTSHATATGRRNAISRRSFAPQILLKTHRDYGRPGVEDSAGGTAALIPRTVEQEDFHPLRELLHFAICILLAFCIARVLNVFVIQQTIVDGSSMVPCLTNGERLLMEKVSYRFEDPERFDIVVFPFEPDVYYIKRVIALPGETIQIKDGLVYIDNTVLEEDIFGLEEIENPGVFRDPYTLGKDEYVVLGDNRNHSLDSRYEIVGVITKDRIIGRAFARIFPFRTAGFLK